MKLQPESKKELTRIALRHGHLHRCPVGGLCGAAPGWLGEI